MDRRRKVELFQEMGGTLAWSRFDSRRRKKLVLEICLLNPAYSDRRKPRRRSDGGRQMESWRKPCLTSK